MVVSLLVVSQLYVVVLECFLADGNAFFCIFCSVMRVVWKQVFLLRLTCSVPPPPPPLTTGRPL